MQGDVEIIFLNRLPKDRMGRVVIRQYGYLLLKKRELFYQLRESLSKYWVIEWVSSEDEATVFSEIVFSFR